MRVLVASASKYGATHDVARALGDGLRRRGLDVVRRPAEDVHDLRGVDAVVLGSAVYAGRWLPPARTMATLLGADLQRMPVWLFSSGPIGHPDPVPEDEPADVAHLARATGAREHRLLAGKLDRSTLGFGDRMIVRALRVQEGDFRDWAAIDAFAADIAAALTSDLPAADAALG